MLMFTSRYIKNMIVSGHDLGKIKQALALEKEARPQGFPQLRPRKYCGPRGNKTVLIIKWLSRKDWELPSSFHWLKSILTAV